MSKEVILTGIRANNDLTIGNYFGGLLPIIDMAKNRSEQYQVNLFVPDLHSFTTPVDLSQLQDQIWHNLRLFTAAGLPLDNQNVHIYRQSQIPAHSELTWILSCFTGFGEMSRMTQFKDKSAKLTDDRISVGLFSYPILMAADILLYNSSYVPVGEDQTQHLEFTRDIAERFNTMAGRYGQDPVFVVPRPVKEQHTFFGKDQGLRIKDLQDPSKKMSKSDDTGKGVIFLSEEPAEAAKKVMGATTDSVGSINLDWDNQPGVSNLLTILALLQNRPLDEVVSKWRGNERYGDFKKAVAEALQDFLAGLQAKLAQVDNAAIQAKLEDSESQMRKTASNTLFQAQKVVGLRS